jgi:hypothetical protein
MLSENESISPAVIYIFQSEMIAVTVTYLQRWASALFSLFHSREREAKKEPRSAKKIRAQKSEGTKRERKITNQSWQSYPGGPVLADLSWQSLLSFSGCPIAAVMSRLSCTGHLALFVLL